mgnify:CR=1 FL=1
MKKIRKGIVVTIVVLATLVLTACASSKSDNAVVVSSSQYTTQSESAYDYDYMDYGSVAKEAEYGEEDMKLTSTSGLAVESSNTTTMDKIITNVNLDVETREFDKLIETIKEEITILGGYDEKTEINGNRYNSRSNNRYAYIVARIPKDRLYEFVNIVNDNANVINETSSKTNVTLEYVDTESRKKSLEIEQERLFSLLEKTETLEDIVTLESRLSSIRYELQMYETELRTMDNKVDYSTVTISINEVERMTPTQEKETVFTRIKNGFSNTMYDISEGFKNFFVWFVVNLPYIIIWAVIIGVAVVVIKRFLRRKNNKGYTSRIEDSINKSDRINDGNSGEGTEK